MQAANRLPAAASIPRCGNGSRKNTRTEGQQAHTKHYGTLSGRFYSRGHRAMRSVDDAPAFEAAIVIHGIREGIRPGVPVVASLIVAAPLTEPLYETFSVTVMTVPAGTLPLVAPEYPPPEKVQSEQLTL